MKNKILKNIVFFTIISFIVFGFLVDLSFAASCGSSNGGTFASPPTSNLCSIDTSPSSVVTNPTTFNWSCYYDCCNSGSWVDRSASTPKASSYYDDVAISATGQYQSIGDNGDVFVSSDFGSTWTKYGKLTNGVGSMGCANVKGFAISETGQRQIMACDTGMFYSSNYGQTWTKSGTISGFVSLDASQNGQYLVANSVSNIYTSSDYGQTWTSRTTALTSAGASSSSGIYASAISSDGQKIGVTGKTSTKDAVFYSSNGGTSFTKKIEYSLGALDDYKDVDMSADGTRFSMIYKTATTGYRVYYSVDSATTFSYYDFGTSLVRRIEMSASGRCQIASVGVGQVYVSSNYGASWSLAVSGNLNVDVAMSASGLNKAVVGTDAIYAYSASPSTNCYSSLSCSAINSSIVNGSCGSSSGQTFTSAPSTNLCNLGTASSVTSGTSTYTWTCSGSGGGTNASCSATRNYIVTYDSNGGSCTPASRTVSYNATADAPSCSRTGYILSSFTRTSGSGGTLNASTGAVTNVTGSQTIRADWTLIVNGSCGTASKIYLSTASSYGADTFCATGTASPLSPVFPVTGTPTTWQCQGSGGGTTATCTASKNRKPAIVNGTPSYSVLAGNKINFTGFSASDADGEALTYAWGCTDGGTFTNNLIANPEYIAPATARTDTCSLLVSDGKEVATSTVTVTVIAPAVVNGSCGTASKIYLSTASSYGADTFCATGTASPLSPVFPVGGTPTTWQCQGSGGGTTATCTAYKNRKPGIITGNLSYVVIVNNKINFTGFSASDADGEALSYAWGCTDGGTFTNNLVPNPQYIAPATPRTDTCNLLVSDGMEVVFATVTVSVSDVIVYGTCGTAAKAYPSGSSSYGLDTFCNPGTPSPLNPVFPVTGTPTTWQCQGSGGGTTAICTATLNAPLTSAISADGFKNPLDVANDLSSTEEECWYCDHYKNTSNEIVPAAGGAVGNIQFKFNYQGTTNLTGYQFAMSTGANPDLAVIKSDDWVNYSVAPGGTVTVSAVKIGGINNNLSVKLNASESLAQIPYNSSPYNWWVKVKNSGGEESAWIPATGHSYTSKSHRYPVVKVALRSIVNDLLACTTVASSGLVFNASDPCYATCGAANVVTATDLENSTKWKCSVCYDQVTNTPKPCAINSVTWELPADAPVGFGLKTGSTLTTANPTFTGIESGQIIDNVRITISGSSCSIEGGLDSYTPLPLWIER